MKVVLSTSPHVRHPAVLQEDFVPSNGVMYSFAPIGLLSLVALLRRERPDVDCELYDLNRRILTGAIPVDETFYLRVAEDICSSSPDVVGFMTECDSYHHVLQFCAAVKARAREIAIVLGGPHASAIARQTMDRCPEVDAVVIGEGELTFPDVLDTLESTMPSPVPGALLRRSGTVLDGGPRALVDSLDDLPPPAYDLYRPDPGEEIFLEVGRGCPFQCTFCSTAPYWKRRHRVKSPERVVHEVSLVQELFGTTRMHFTHDLFTTDRRWVRAVCAALIAAGAPIRWTCSARTDTVDEGLLALMARAGCDAIYFGIESGSERILEEIRKDIPLERSFDMLQACKDAGITPNAGFIVGFPTEDEESLRDTFVAYERALRLGSRPTHVFAYCPFADSSLYPELRGLECDGHFLDLPLGEAVDTANRRRVAGDSDLFGAYFRPPLAHVVPGEPDALRAVDEFTPLVEATLVPSLALARLLGGMYAVFRRWLRWIYRSNDTRGLPAYRRGYGTPAAFGSFLLDELLAAPGAPAAAIAAAQAVQVNLRVAESMSLRASTTMASHRSLVVPIVAKEIEFGTWLSLGAIVDTLALEYDVTPALMGRADIEITAAPTYLVWQARDEATARLLRVDRFIFETLELLRADSMTAADVILRQLSPEDGAADADGLDAPMLLSSLSRAARERLVVMSP